MSLSGDVWGRREGAGAGVRCCPRAVRRLGRACSRAAAAAVSGSRGVDRAPLGGTDGGVRGPSLRRAARSAKAAGGGSALGLVPGRLGGPRGGGFARLDLGPPPRFGTFASRIRETNGTLHEPQNSNAVLNFHAPARGSSPRRSRVAASGLFTAMTAACVGTPWLHACARI